MVGEASQNCVTVDREMGAFDAIQANFLDEVGKVSARFGRTAGFQTSSAPLFRRQFSSRNPHLSGPEQIAHRTSE
jgi:hypothetical protein